MLRKLADLPIRLSIGFHLIYGTQDNVFSWDRMLEFSEFLHAFGFPFPLVSAIVSVYAQFLCGLLFIIGWKIRWAGIVMVINFVIAIFAVHLEDAYPSIFPAISMLAGSLFLILYGQGWFTLDAYLAQKKEG